MSAIKSLMDNILFRILLTTIIAIGLSYFMFKSNWLWVAIMLALSIVSIWWSIMLYNQQIKKVIFLLDALENNDNALRFTENEGNTESKLINKLLNRVSQILHEAKSETIQQEKYYELILNSVNTGIIVLNENGAVYQKNSEAMRILGIEVLTHVKQLGYIDNHLMEKIASAHAGEKLYIKFNNEKERVQLSLRVSQITIRKKYLKIITFNDINSELDNKEIDTWTRLIRVLTHEIMNSVTPITSLSDTLLSMSVTKDEEIRHGLQTISSTGKGLLSFVDSYRKFTRIPTPEPSLFYIKAFMERMTKLAIHQYKCNNIIFNVTITPPDLILYADEQLISQVVINILKNAVQAIGVNNEGLIEIKAYANEDEEIIIKISNNGSPIPTEVAEQIFIPFFTTKEGGSGIGLSLSKQIMNISGGKILLLPSQPGGMTTFQLTFK